MLKIEAHLSMIVLKAAATAPGRALVGTGSATAWNCPQHCLETEGQGWQQGQVPAPQESLAQKISMVVARSDTDFKAKSCKDFPAHQTPEFGWQNQICEGPPCFFPS